MKNREESVRQALRDTAAEFFVREAGPQSLITVTRADVSPDFTTATIYLSVLPEEKALAALGLAERNVQELKDFLHERIRLPRMPHIAFGLERGSDLTALSQEE